MVMVLPKNPKKYVGHIRSFDNRYTFEYISREMKVKELFYHKDIYDITFFDAPERLITNLPADLPELSKNSSPFSNFDMNSQKLS